MRAAQLAQATRTEGCEPQAHDAVIGRVDVAGNESRFGGAVDEPDRAVMTEQQPIGDVTDRRPLAVCVAADDEQELVLRGRDTHPGGLLLAPPEKLPEPGPEIEKASVVVVGKLRVHIYIS